MKTHLAGPSGKVGRSPLRDRFRDPGTELRVQQVKTPLEHRPTGQGGMELPVSVSPSAKGVLAAAPKLRTRPTRCRSPQIFASAAHSVVAFLSFLPAFVTLQFLQSFVMFQAFSWPE